MGRNGALQWIFVTMLPLACAWDFGGMDPDAVDKSCGKVVDDTTIQMTRREFNLKFVGTCSLFPCGDDHGDTECVRHKIHVSDSSYSIRVLTSFWSICMCSNTDCTMDHYTCHSFRKWNASNTAKEKLNPTYFHNKGKDEDKIMKGVKDFVFGIACLAATFFTLGGTGHLFEFVHCQWKGCNKGCGRIVSMYKFFKAGETPDDFICGIRKGKILYYVMSALLMYIPYTIVFQPDNSMRSICESAMDDLLNTEYLVSAFFFWICAEFSWKVEERRVFPMPRDAEGGDAMVTYAEMCAMYKDRGEALSDAQAQKYWNNLHVAPLQGFRPEGPAVLVVSALYRDVVALDFWHKWNEYAKLFQLTSRLLATNLILIVLAQRNFALAMLWITLMSIVRGSFQLRRFFAKSEGDFYTEWKTLYDSDKAAVVSITPSDCYQHAATPIGKKVLIIFFAQIFLFLVYVLAMRDDSHKMLCNNDINWNLARITVVIQLVLSLNQGKQFEENLKEWAAMFYARGIDSGDKYKIKIKSENPGDAKECGDVFLKVRFLMSWLVNAVIFDLLISTAFLTLIGNDDPLDYVKDCLAIGFITQIDDLDDDDKLEGFYFVEVGILIENYKAARAAYHGRVLSGTCGGWSLTGACSGCSLCGACSGWSLCGACTRACGWVGKVCSRRQQRDATAREDRGRDYEALNLD